MTTSRLPLAAAALAAITAISLVAITATARDSSSAEYLAAAPTVAPVKVTVKALDFAFQLPDTLMEGVTELELINEGKEPHHIQIVRLEQGKTMPDLFAAMKAGGPPPAWAKEVGGPNAGAPVSRAFVNLTPGRYVFLCFIPSPDGTPHVMKGMVKEVIVAPRRGARAAAEAAAKAPTPTTTMTLVDYGYQLTKPITKGRQVIRVVNGAKQPHEVFIARLLPGKTAGDMLEWEKNPQGPPPVIPVGGTTGMANGESNTIVVDFEPGEYALYCFVPDAGDGKPHVAHGMVTQITIK